MPHREQFMTRLSQLKATNDQFSPSVRKRYRKSHHTRYAASVRGRHSLPGTRASASMSLQ